MRVQTILRQFSPNILYSTCLLFKIKTKRKLLNSVKHNYSKYV